MKIRNDRIVQHVTKRSVVTAGRKTSITLEDEFWTAAKDIAAEKNIAVSHLVEEIDKRRGETNLSSAVRLYVLDYYRVRGEKPV